MKKIELGEAWLMMKIFVDTAFISENGIKDDRLKSSSEGVVGRLEIFRNDIFRGGDQKNRPAEAGL